MNVQDAGRGSLLPEPSQGKLYTTQYCLVRIIRIWMQSGIERKYLNLPEIFQGKSGRNLVAGLS